MLLLLLLLQMKPGRNLSSGRGLNKWIDSEEGIGRYPARFPKFVLKLLDLQYLLLSISSKEERETFCFWTVTLRATGEDDLMK